MTAADSVAFPVQNTVCDFYKWGARMFLWLTSPEGDGLVLDGESVFNVLPANHKGARYLQDTEDTGEAMRFAVRSEKADDIGEIGQAGSGGVLMSQNGSLVYYGVHINDVYAYFLTGQKNGQFPLETKFPRTQDDLNAVESYVAKAFPHVTLSDADALTMELKTSWVEASTVADASDFITMPAEIPNYEKVSDTRWERQGTRTTELALVGMHVVGTVQNHPEFVWATFEHVANAPNAPYYYTDTNGDLKMARDPSDADYIFAAKGSGLHQIQANVECMKEGDDGDIVAKTDGGKPVCQGGIVPSDTLRLYPWGSPNDKSAAENNTLLISNNNSVRGQLSDGDVRANYVQIGGIWTSPAKNGEDAPIPDTAAFHTSDLRGSKALANATMETYVQGTSCFSCHKQTKGAPNSFQPFDLSHIYSQIVPLTPSD